MDLGKEVRYNRARSKESYDPFFEAKKWRRRFFWLLALAVVLFVVVLVLVLRA
jgi:uncharacterized protein YpmS